MGLVFLLIWTLLSAAWPTLLGCSLLRQLVFNLNETHQALFSAISVLDEFVVLFVVDNLSNLLY